MNDSVSILVAVFFILIALRWMLGKNMFFFSREKSTHITNKGGNQSNGQQAQRRTPVRRTHRVTPQMVSTFEKDNA